MKVIFEYDGYKNYITDYIKSRPKNGYGLKQAFANAAGCQVAYISHVLNGDNHLSNEQAEAIGRFMGLNEEELEFLLLLVNKERAGTTSLKKLYSKIMAEKCEAYSNLKNRMKIKEALTVEDQAIYYSKWYYSAIHMLVTIPEYRTPEKICAYLNLPLKNVRQVLEFLTARSVLALVKNEYVVKGSFLHLEKSSPLLNNHHQNWRNRAINSLANEKEFDLHFSSCFTLSEKDIKKIRTMISTYIEEISDVVKPSKEERLCALNIDYFEI